MSKSGLSRKLENTKDRAKRRRTDQCRSNSPKPAQSKVPTLRFAKQCCRYCIFLSKRSLYFTRHLLESIDNFLGFKMFESTFSLLPFERTDEFSITDTFSMGGKIQIQDSLLHTHFSIRGKISDLKIPSYTSHEKKEGLWNSTCFELFIKSERVYLEWNFAPSGEWWLMDFSDYRKRKDSSEIAKLAPQKIKWIRTDTLSASLSLPLPFTPRSIGVACILETENKKTHWALKHLSSKPDFHDSRTFLSV